MINDQENDLNSFQRKEICIEKKTISAISQERKYSLIKIMISAAYQMKEIFIDQKILSNDLINFLKKDFFSLIKKRISIASPRKDMRIE